MRDLIISAAIMIVLIGGWLIFDSYSENHLSDFADYIIDDTDEINEIDFCLAKAEKYIKAEDVSNSSGELNSLAEQLIFMYEQQDIKAANIL